MKYQKIVADLEHLSRNERLELCSEFLNNLKEALGETKQFNQIP